MAQSTLPHQPAEQRNRGHQRDPGRRSRSTLASVFTLGLWQLRQTWRLLIVIGMGILVAVVLVCAIPLYTQVAMTAGLRQTLASDPSNLYLTTHAQSPLFSQDAFQTVQQELTQDLRSVMGTQIASSPNLSVQISKLSFSPGHFLTVLGSNVTQAGGHVKLLQGRLPVVTSANTIEFALTAQGASDLGLTVGKTIKVQAYSVFDPTTGQPRKNYLSFKLVGIIAPTDGTDVFWHEETFKPEFVLDGLSTDEYVPMLVSNTQLMNILAGISTSLQQGGINGRFPTNLSLDPEPDIYWYYSFDFSQIDINHLSDLTNELNGVLTTISNYPQQQPYIVGTTAQGPLSVLQAYSNRVAVLELPTTCLAYLIAGLALFFVLCMTDILLERQVAAITLLRSRGAAVQQVLGSLLGQSVVLGLLAFLAGPLIAIGLTIWLISLTIVPSERSALNLITTNPLAVAQGQLERDLIVVGVAILAVTISLWGVLRSNILTLRRESARSTHKPFWQRFRLDLLAAAVALVGFGFSLYIAQPGVLDVRTRTLILPLTTVSGMLFLLIGALLLFLRVLPGLLRAGERLAGRNRGAAPVLALAQMARAPRQSLRMTLLFALAVTFALFTLIFSQTQAQRLQDITTYQIGGDFSGLIPQVLSDEDWNSQLAFYRSIKGITSVTMGTSETLVDGNDENITVELEAADSSTYANTIYWSSRYSSQPLSSLTALLQRGQAEAEKQNIIPAIIDDAAAQNLGVSVGQKFVLSDFHGPMNYVVVGIVHYLPTIYDAASGTGSDTLIPQGGILVDFQTYSTVALAVNENGVSATQVWLRSGKQTTDLASARSALFTGTYELENGEDRRVLAQSLANDPLYGAITGILALGAIVSLLLGIAGNLLVSWWSARSRQTNFAILRALGFESRQIIGILIWEQGIVYSAGLILGAILSLLFSLVVLPVFVFSPSIGASTAEAFYIIQSVPPVIPAFPVLSMCILLAGIIAICVIVLGAMVRIVTRNQVGQTLRLNED